MGRSWMLGLLATCAACRMVNPEFDGPAADASTSGTADSATGAGTATSTVSTTTGQGSATGDSTSTSTTEGGTSQGVSATDSTGATTEAITATTTDSTGTGGIVCGTQEIMDDGPVLYWRLGEANGNTATDISGNGQDGTYNGVSLGAEGIAWDGDTAVEFAGNMNSYVQLFPVGAFPTVEFTVEFWVLVEGDGEDYGFFSYATNQSDNEIYIDDAVELDAIVSEANVNTTITLAAGVWHHVAATWRNSDGRVRVFINGSLAVVQTAQSVGAVLEGTGSLILGQDQDSVGGGFDMAQTHRGRLDEVVVFDQDLDESRIAAHVASIDCTP